MSLLDGDGTLQRVEGWSAEVSAQAERAAELARQVERLTATGRSDDGVIEVTINSAGVLTDLRLDDQGRWWRLSDIADEVMAVLQQAHRSMAEQVTGLVGDTMGLDSQMGQEIVRGFTSRVADVGGADDAVVGSGRRWNADENGVGRGW